MRSLPSLLSSFSSRDAGTGALDREGSVATDRSVPITDSGSILPFREASPIYSGGLQVPLWLAERFEPGALLSSEAILSGTAFQRQMLEGLRQFNADPDILYMAELRQRPDAAAKNLAITASVQGCGFQRPSNDEYRYQGEDPAKALRNLLNVRPLVLDCATSLHLLTYKALLDSLGDAQFNTYIEKACDGVLSIDKQEAPRVPSDRTAYYSARHEQNENGLPSDLQHGDRLWIQGPADDYAFHPASEINAHNVLGI